MFSRSFLNDTGGNAALMMGLIAAPMVIVVAGTLEMSRVNSVDADTQQVLDSVILAAAMEGEAGFPARAQALAARHMAQSMPYSYTAAFSAAPGAGGETNFSGSIVTHIDNSLLRVIGRQRISVRSESTASLMATPPSLPCVMALSPNQTEALRFNSGATISAAGCDVQVNSTAEPGATFNSGISIDFQNILIASARITNNFGALSNVTLNSPQVADPLAGTIPIPADTSCDHWHQNYNASTSLTPGVYCGWTNFNSGVNIDLDPGLYVIKSGGWNVNGGDWTGTGVTFYFDDTSGIQFNSAVQATLTPPTTGDYANVMMFERPGLAGSQMVFNDSRGFDMDGLVYLPSRELTFNSGGQLQAKSFNMIARSFIFNQVNWQLEGSPGASGGAGASAGEIRLTH